MLDALLEKKGILSRQIGEAKKAGEPIDSLLLEMKQVSAKINAIKQTQKEAQENFTDPGLDKTAEKGLLADLFRSPVLADSSSGGGVKEISVKEISANDFDKWDAYVASKTNSSIYHFIEFKRIVEKSFGHDTVYLAAFDGQNNVCGILPAVVLKSALFGHFLVSLPYFTYGTALADSDAIANSLYSALFEEAAKRRANHVELRATLSQESLQAKMPAKQSKVSMVRALPGSSEQLWEDIGTKVRAQIKKSQRFGLEMRFGKSELLDDFYRVFAENMRDLGTPVYSKTFFAEMIGSALSDEFTIGVVYLRGKPVAACFLMQHKGMMEIPWASSLNSVNHLNANMFMYWEVLQYAIQQKNRFFDFGRSSKDAGTYRFKKQWGAEPQQLYWYYWLPSGGEMPELNPNNPKYKLLIAVWQKLPVWLTKLIGPPVVKYLP